MSRLNNPCATSSPVGDPVCFHGIFKVLGRGHKTLQDVETWWENHFLPLQSRRPLHRRRIPNKSLRAPALSAPVAQRESKAVAPDCEH